MKTRQLAGQQGLWTRLAFYDGDDYSDKDEAETDNSVKPQIAGRQRV
jgi:hypothetical protein